jgi:hypothetical protein
VARLARPRRQEHVPRSDRRELADDDLDLGPMAGTFPEERLGELAAADPEEAGHLDVELASCLPGRRRNRTLTSSRDLDRPVRDVRDPGGSSAGRLDHRRHAPNLAGLDQRGMFAA